MNEILMKAQKKRDMRGGSSDELIRPVSMLNQLFLFFLSQISCLSAKATQNALIIDTATWKRRPAKILAPSSDAASMHSAMPPTTRPSASASPDMWEILMCCAVSVPNETDPKDKFLSHNKLRFILQHID